VDARTRPPTPRRGVLTDAAHRSTRRFEVPCQ
jgi:hypothetical protein